MTSDLLKEGFSQGAILPTTLILDFQDIALQADATSDWNDFVATPANVVTPAGALSTQSVLNDSPAKFAITGSGFDLLVPGNYECMLAAEMRETGGVATANYGLSVGVSTASPTIFYEDDTIGDTSRALQISEVRSVVRKFVIDIVDPETVRVMAAVRGGTGTISLLGMQLTMKRISKYTAAARA